MDKKKKEKIDEKQQPKFNKRKKPTSEEGEGLEEFVSSDANLRAKDNEPPKTKK